MKKTEVKPMVKVTVRLPEDLFERAKIRAIMERTSLQDIAAQALEERLRKPLAHKEGRR